MTQEEYICPYVTCFARTIIKKHEVTCPLYTPPAQEELFDCSGCSDPNSEGTHQGHSKQHGCVGCLHEEKKHVSDCCKSDYSAYGDTVNYVCNSCNKVCVVILLNPKNPDDYKAVEPPQKAQEEKHKGMHFVCKDRISVGKTNIFGGQILYVDCCKCNNHDCQPPQPKEPETWEEEFNKLMIPPKFHSEYEGKDCLMCGHPMPNSRGAILMKDFVRTTRLSTAAEERKRVCEEIISLLRKNNPGGSSEYFDTEGNFQKVVENDFSKCISLIQSIKNSV